MIGFSASDSQSVNSQRQNCVTQCSSHRVTLKLLLAALLISGLLPETNLLSQHQCQAADHPKTSPHALLKSPQVLVIAHRGNSSQAPENTLAAFREAVNVGANLV